MSGDRKKIWIGAAALITAIALITVGTRIADRRMRLRELEQQGDTGATASAAAPAVNRADVTLEGKSYRIDHRTESFLFIGTDSSGNEEGEGASYYGTMADYILLMVLDYTDDSYGCIQINRNTMTDVDELDGEGLTVATRELPIFTAHWYGANKEMSAQNTVKAVSHLLGDLSAIRGYYILNMKDIRLMNSAVGGVTLTMEEDHTDIDPAMVKGAAITLTDQQAEGFVRARMSLREPTNEARNLRQRQYMEQFFAQAADRSMRDPRFATKLWDTLKSSAMTNLNGNAFSRIAEMFLNGSDKGILIPEGENRLGTALEDGEVHEQFYIDPSSLSRIMVNLYSLKPEKPEKSE